MILRNYNVKFIIKRTIVSWSQLFLFLVIFCVFIYRTFKHDCLIRYDTCIPTRWYLAMVKSSGNRMQWEIRRSARCFYWRRCVRRKCLLTHEFARKVASRHRGIPRKFQTCVYYDSTEEEKESEEIKHYRYSRFSRRLHSVFRRQDKDGFTKRGELYGEIAAISPFSTDNKVHTANFYALLISRCLRTGRSSTSVTPSLARWQANNITSLACRIC